jgi:hypothetical protein
MVRIKSILPFVAFCLFSQLATAQTSADGSIYSRFGIGELYQFNSSQAQGMGGGAFGLTGLNYAHFGNPALLGDQVLTRLAAGVRFENIQIQDASDNVARLTDGQLGAVQLSFPIMTRRWGVGASFAPFSRTGYRIEEIGVVPQPAGVQDTVRYQINYEGGGGLQQLSLASGVQLNRYLSLGASADFVFGILEETRRTFFDRSGYQPTTIVSATRLSGVTGTAGASVRLPNALRRGDVLSFGATVVLPTELTGDRLRAIGESLDRDTLVVTEGSVSIPLRTRFGVAYRPNARFAFVADAQYEPWSRFESTFAAASPLNPVYNDRVRISAGAEMVPAGQDLFASFWGRAAYRIGFYTDRSYVDPFDGANIQTSAVTAGFGLPALFSGTYLDINFEVGRRGTTDLGLVRDTFLRVAANVNIGERWFDRRRLR